MATYEIKSMLTIEERDRLICEMWADTSTLAIARHFCMTRSELKKIAKVYGLPPKELSNAQVAEKAEKICQMWVDGVKLHVICSTLAVSMQTVNDTIKRSGLSLRGKNSCKPKWNTEFFERRDNHITAYWAGFLFADGCLSGNNLSLQIGLKDFEHLQKFAEAIAAPPEYARKTPCKVSKHNPSGFKCCVSISYLNLPETLLYWGIAPRKTYNWHEPQCSTMNEVQGFLVGLIDGDGHINLKNGEVSIAISSYTPQLIEWVKDSLDCLNYEGYIRVQSLSNNCYQLVLATAREDIRSLARSLQPWRYPCLDRKWDRLFDVLELPMRKPSKLVVSRRTRVNFHAP